MKILIFDTETTGLPKQKEIIAKNKANNWPHIVSISWCVLDTNTNQATDIKDYIIKPNNWIIPTQASDIHHITQEKAITYGHNLQDVLLEFITENYDVLIAHNLEFDYNVLRNAMIWDLGWNYNPLADKLKFCSMKNSIDICMLPGRDGNFKNPKLSELYYYVFKKFPNFEKLHSSEYDVYVLTQIIKESRELRHKLGLPIIPLK